MQTTSKEEISTYEVLRYIRSAFDDENVMDSIPLEAAGNPGAWEAWRTHQRQSGKLLRPNPVSAWHDGLSDGEEKKLPEPPTASKVASPTMSARRPGEWSWDGVWEDRVKKGIAASLSEPVLYGGVGVADDAVSLDSYHGIHLLIFSDTIFTHGRR